MWSHTLLFPPQRLFFSVWYNTSLPGKVDELVVLPVIFSNHLICGEISCWEARGFKYCCMINKASSYVDNNSPNIFKMFG